MSAAEDAPVDGGFVGRWSARKRAARHDALHDERPDTPKTVESIRQGATDATSGVVRGSAAIESPTSSVEPPAHARDQRSGRAALNRADPESADADMPPIESLDASSDLSAFFNDGVSAALRRAALRHVFRSASYNVRDGLNDYDGDYTEFEPLGDTVTADMKFHAARKERLASERARAEDEERLALADEDEPDDPAVSADDQGTAQTDKAPLDDDAAAAPPCAEADENVRTATDDAEHASVPDIDTDVAVTASRDHTPA